MAPDRESSDKTSLAAAASDRIRAIVEAAEQTAAAIKADAEEEARQIQAEAEEHATEIRSKARSDLHALLDSIRGRMKQLSADFEQLEATLEGSAAPVDSLERADVAPSAPGTPPPEAPERPEPPETAEPPETPEATEPPGPTESPEPAPATAGGADLESARLVALNMALDGADRQEVDEYLRENFELSDPKSLLDEVYASVGA